MTTAFFLLFWKQLKIHCSKLFRDKHNKLQFKFTDQARYDLILWSCWCTYSFCPYFIWRCQYCFSELLFWGILLPSLVGLHFKHAPLVLSRVNVMGWWVTKQSVVFLASLDVVWSCMKIILLRKAWLKNLNFIPWQEMVSREQRSFWHPQGQAITSLLTVAVLLE